MFNIIMFDQGFCIPNIRFDVPGGKKNGHLYHVIVIIYAKFVITSKSQS